jgi:protein-disulfide isomerase
MASRPAFAAALWATLSGLGLAACTTTTSTRPAGSTAPGAISVPVPAASPAAAAAPAGADLGPVSFVAGGSIPVDADDAVWGGAEAPVTVVCFLDYQCPYCAAGWSTLGGLLGKYGRDLRIAFKQLPLEFHREAYPSAVAAQAVMGLAGTNAFRRYSELLFGNADVNSAAQRETWATTLGIEPERFRAAVEDPRYGKQVARDAELARMNGIEGTPAFVINGVLVMGAAPLEEFAAVIDRELPAARSAQRSGLAPAALYEARVRANADAPDDR